MDTYTLKNYIKSLRRKEVLVALAAGFVSVIVLASLLFFLAYRFFYPAPQPMAKPETTPVPMVSQLPTKVTLVEENGKQVPDNLPVSYQVKAGDSTWKIAQAFYGSGFNYVDIEHANNLRFNQLLEVGQVLIIPRVEARTEASAALEPVASQPGSAAPAPSEQPVVEEKPVAVSATTYEVKSGDSLWKIAGAQLNDSYKWVELYAHNRQVVGKNPNLIYPGQVLQLQVEAKK